MCDALSLSTRAGERYGDPAPALPGLIVFSTTNEIIWVPLRVNPSRTREATASFAHGCIQRYRVFTVTLANKQHYRAVRSLRHSTLPRFRVNPSVVDVLAVIPRKQTSYRLFARYGTYPYRALPHTTSGLHSPLPRFKQTSWAKEGTETRAAKMAALPEFV
jgi:hypothetical protein